MNSIRKTTNIAKSDTVDVGGHVGSLRLLRNLAPAYELRIDRDGTWFHEGVEIVRKDISDYFSRHLVRKGDGYVVRIGGDECPVIVEDAPFVVVRIEKDCGNGFTLLLNDGSAELLDPQTLEIRDSNIPYCIVRANMEARLSRPAYYQLVEFIDYDEEADRFYLSFDGKTIEIETK